MDLPYTHIYEWAKRKMGITRDEYALCNYIETWSAHPENARPGWCNRTLKQKADFIDVTPRGLTKMQNRMIDIGLVQKDPMTAHVRITIAWWNTVKQAEELEKERQQKREQSSHADGEQSSANEGTKFRNTREQSSATSGNKVPTHNKESLFNDYNNDINDSDDSQKNEKPVDIVVKLMNELLKPVKPFQTTKKTTEAVNGRLRDKYTVDDLCLVVELKAAEWIGTHMEPYFRPATLFGVEKFESYLVAASNWKAKGKPGFGNKKIATTTFGADESKFEQPQIF